jgi:hypothetical protein
MERNVDNKMIECRKLKRKIAIIRAPRMRDEDQANEKK